MTPIDQDFELPTAEESDYEMSRSQSDWLSDGCDSELCGLSLTFGLTELNSQRAVESPQSISDLRQVPTVPTVRPSVSVAPAESERLILAHIELAKERCRVWAKLTYREPDFASRVSRVAQANDRLAMAKAIRDTFPVGEDLARAEEVGSVRGTLPPPPNLGHLRAARDKRLAREKESWDKMRGVPMAAHATRISAAQSQQGPPNDQRTRFDENLRIAHERIAAERAAKLYERQMARAVAASLVDAPADACTALHAALKCSGLSSVCGLSDETCSNIHHRGSSFACGPPPPGSRGTSSVVHCAEADVAMLNPPAPIEDEDEDFLPLAQLREFLPLAQLRDGTIQSKDDRQFEQAIQASLLDQSGPPPRDQPVPRAVRLTGGCRGLSNLGATCYMNAVVQALVSIPQVRDALHRSRSQEVATTIEMLAATLEQFTYYQEHIGIAPDAQLCQPFDTASMAHLFYEIHPGFSQPVVQQDAQEFFLKLVDSLEMDNSTRHIANLFQIRHEITRTCGACGSSSLIEEPVTLLMLRPPQPVGDGRVSIVLDTLVAEYYGSQMLQADAQLLCGRCGARQDATETPRILTTPQVLMINVARFYSDIVTSGNATDSAVREARKNDAHVAVPATLDMSPYMKESAVGGSEQYHLAAVVVHAGDSLNSGHYYAYVWHSMGQVWLKMNDEEVTVVSFAEVQADQAYLVFYAKTAASVAISDHPIAEVKERNEFLQ